MNQSGLLKTPLVRSFLIAVVIVLAGSVNAAAQDVIARLSSREAYVGSPVILQIQINNARRYSIPDEIKVDGCDVVQAGAPQQSTQINILNGRRTENRTVSILFRVTPRTAGTYEVPSLKIEVDGKIQETKAIRFVATNSETGDLLFVEIEGKKDRVYVGEPLDLSLKIWIKPFRDRQSGIELNEGHMWQMLSDSTAWGSFAERITELAKNNQRPSGKPVLRDDENGDPREYFLYELDATVYPARPGSIDGSDVQIVVNYPEKLGRSKDPFDAMFEGGFGGSSLLKEMMEDSFFGNSPFGQRLVVTNSRPIVANAKVDSTEVVAVPEKGKPADYRGAVGNYQILTEASPLVVDAGDPVTLKIGIVGTGPMELVQAPPLSDLSSVTDSFKVDYQSLAGFVQDDTKVFVTTIRPRSADVKSIPPIPFSFFDPVNEQYQTVYSKPIPVQVNESDILGLDAIVSGIDSNPASNQAAAPGSSSSIVASAPDFSNDFSMEVLQNGSGGNPYDWKLFGIVPPLVWVTVLIARLLLMTVRIRGWLSSQKKRAAKLLRTAETKIQIRDAMLAVLSAHARTNVDNIARAAGALRTRGLFDEANELEIFINRLEKEEPSSLQPKSGEREGDSFARTLKEAIDLAEKAGAAIDAADSHRIRTGRSHPRKFPGRSLAPAWLLLLLPALCGAATQPERLSSSQLRDLLNEANATYQLAESTLADDSLEAASLFRNAAEKYRLIAESGIRNADLFVNTANAHWRGGQYGQAIANYHRALQIAPGSIRALRNLAFSREQIEKQRSKAGDSPISQSPAALAENFQISMLLQSPVQYFGISGVMNSFAVSSIIFWLLVILKTLRLRTPVLRWAIVPGAIMAVSGMALLANETTRSPMAIVIVDRIELRTGDGEEFEISETIDSTNGLETRILDQRNRWSKVVVPSSGERGWIRDSQMEIVETPFSGK